MPRRSATGPGGPVGGSISRRGVLRRGTLRGVLLQPVGCRTGGEDELVEVDACPTATHPAGRSVIVIGAGAAGLSAAHLHARAGVEVVLLEAGTAQGSRRRHALDVVDVPLPLGAEWLHDDAQVLRGIAGQQVEVELVGYGPDDTLGTHDGELTIERMDEHDDLKLVGPSRLEVFDTYVVAGMTDRLQVDTRVVRIDATGEQVAVTVTAPVTILRDRDITFVPDLPDDKWAAIDDVEVWGGIKVFVEFDERFSRTFLTFPDSDTSAGQRLNFHAAHGQDAAAHVLGLFAVGVPAGPYQGLDPDALRARVLAELDEVFDGAASRSYRRHLVQDWSAQAHIRQAYVADHADWRHVRRLGHPAGDRVLFAGDPDTDGENGSEVHVAANSARVAVERPLGSRRGST